MCPLTWQWNHCVDVWCWLSHLFSHLYDLQLSSSLPLLSCLSCRCWNCLCNSPSTAASHRGMSQANQNLQGFAFHCLTGNHRSSDPNNEQHRARYSRHGWGRYLEHYCLRHHSPGQSTLKREAEAVLILLWGWWQLAERRQEAKGKKIFQWLVRKTWTKNFNVS